MKSLKIMVVDDESALLRLTTKYCQQLGHNVVLATDSGNQAFAWFSQHLESVDLILTDRQMNDGDGIELTKKVKLVSPSTPVIMISGGMTEDHAEMVRSVGVSDVLHKPISLGLLAAMIETVCGEKP